MFLCTKCQKPEFHLTQLSEMRILAECVACGGSFVVDTLTGKKPRVEATDPNLNLVWDWKTEKWVSTVRN